MGVTISFLLLIQAGAHGVLHYIHFHDDEHKLKNSDGRKAMHVTTGLMLAFVAIIYFGLGFDGILNYIQYIAIFFITIIIGPHAYLEWRYLKHSNVYVLNLSSLAFLVLCFYYFL
ncbi:DUF4181 domain-containing protein [Alkalibacillus haloalkaliphilus]|uniref:DUF4181 domain-containing protein n=1 Tax=Alkalibacillus haloalkaliphilus TaxID=94136 RepID=UPI0003768C72|nr:DUF4181 domain-containing protein [Alkalibacillus haloalkaliphilus]